MFLLDRLPDDTKRVVEVPRDLVQRKKSEFMNANLREKAIVLDFARRAALALFSTGEQRLASPHDEDALWCVPFLKYFDVFNAEQIDGTDAKVPSAPIERETTANRRL